MTDKVTNMVQWKYEEFAKQFVDIYIENGEVPAGHFARKTFSKEERINSQDFIREEFEKREYTFSEGNEK